MPSEKENGATKSWTPAVPAKRPDNIISSDYARAKKIFTPSYERECRPCMNQLIANEYQRIWWEERDAWANKNLPDKSGTKKSHHKTEGHSRKVVTTESSKTLTIRRKSKKEGGNGTKAGRDKKTNHQEKS